MAQNASCLVDSYKLLHIRGSERKKAQCSYIKYSINTARNKFPEEDLIENMGSYQALFHREIKLIRLNLSIIRHTSRTSAQYTIYAVMLGLLYMNIGFMVMRNM